MILRRAALAAALLIVLCGVTLIFLAGRPPRTFAAAWTAPGSLASNAGLINFGAAPEPHGRWDLLWVDQNNHVLFLPGTGRAVKPVTLDSGEVDQPTLVRDGGLLFGAWIHDYNGGTDLKAVTVSAGGSPHVFTLIRSPAPMEHPYAFAGPNGRPSLVLSWQKYGNYDVFLVEVSKSGSKLAVERRLTKSEYYSFNPQAVTDARGDVDLLHLESCCNQQQFKVEWDRFDGAGRRLGPPHILNDLTERGTNTLQRGEALGRDRAGDIWGAYTLDSGAALIHANRDGGLEGKPQFLDPDPEQPNSIAFALGPRGGYAVWEQNNGLGIDVAGRRFDSGGMGGIDRIEYLSGQQQDVHAAYFGDRYRVVWQSLAPDGSYVFETNQHRKAAGPDLAERLGLGLGNPWTAAVLLFGGALALGVLGTAVNIVDALVLAVLGVLLVRALRDVPGRWLVATAALVVVLYLTFVKPGLPIFFLTTLSKIGLGGPQFVVAAMAGALIFVGLMAQFALRRMDDIYRMAVMVFLGIFFFGFIEAALFVQQELGYI